MLKNPLYIIVFLILALLVNCTKQKSDDTASPATTSEKTTADTSAVIETPQTTQYSSVSTTGLSLEELWNRFYAARDSAQSAREQYRMEKVKLYLLEATEYALALERPDIAAWQLNNIGYYSIEEFKRRTEYDQRIATIESMRRGPEKIVYIKNTKRLFKANLPLLIEAEKQLEKAYDMDKDLDNNDRTQKIYSNLQFIDWIRNFINMNY